MISLKRKRSMAERFGRDREAAKRHFYAQRVNELTHNVARIIGALNDIDATFDNLGEILGFERK